MHLAILLALSVLIVTVLLLKQKDKTQNYPEKSEKKIEEKVLEEVVYGDVADVEVEKPSIKTEESNIKKEEPSSKNTVKNPYEHVIAKHEQALIKLTKETIEKGSFKNLYKQWDSSLPKQFKTKIAVNVHKALSNKYINVSLYEVGHNLVQIEIDVKDA